MLRFAPALPTLTSVRFLAAVWVLLYHVDLLAPGSLGPLTRLASIGFLGVPFFFVLSGFILTHTYGQAAITGSLDDERFWLARLARIYPLYLAALVLGAFQQILARDPATPATLAQSPVASILANVGLVQNWSPTLFRSINGPGWSVACEAAFYLVFPFVAGPLLRLGSKMLVVALLLDLLTGLLLQALGGNLALHYYTDAHSRAWWSGSVLSVGSMYNPIARLDDFLLGILIYRIAVKFSHRNFAFAVLAGSILTYLLARVLLRIAAHLLLDPGRHLYAPSPWQSVFVVASATLIGFLAMTGGETPAWLAHPALVYGGKISYGLYLIHMPILYLARGLGGANWSRNGILPASLVVALALAILGFRFIEEPMRRWILKLRPAPSAC